MWKGRKAEGDIHDQLKKMAILVQRKEHAGTLALCVCHEINMVNDCLPRLKLTVTPKLQAGKCTLDPSPGDGSINN